MYCDAQFPEWPTEGAVCPLCLEAKGAPFHRDQRRVYLQCPVCSLVFVPPRWHLSFEEERACYDLHQNDPNDEGYRRFLFQLAAPVMEMIPLGACGLDFGCGPGPVLSRLFREGGFSCADYDLFYAPDRSLLSVAYDFVVCSEVFEHLRQPREALERMLNMVRSDGVLGIMTQWVRDPEAFRRWRYLDDETHIIFSSPAVWKWVAKKYRLTVEFPQAAITLLYA